jgi:enoyl-[acyl-carrier protein] reductase I
MGLEGTHGVILGVANKRSIAWSIAQRLASQGARLAFCVLDERTEQKIQPLVDSLAGEHRIHRCDVTDDAQLDAAFAEIRDAFGGRIDLCVHSVAFALREDLEGGFLATSRAGFTTALEVSAYSLVATAQRVAPLMTGGGSIVTLTYLGSERVVPGYNVMGVAKAALEASVRYLAEDLGPRGITVNAISAGPIQTLSARGIRGFSKMVDHVAERAPLRRATDVREVADTAAFLLSQEGRGITGETLHVDCGYHAMGM